MPEANRQHMAYDAVAADKATAEIVEARVSVLKNNEVKPVKKSVTPKWERQAQNLLRGDRTSILC